MYLGRVIGKVWATVKNDSLRGQRLLIVQPLTPELAPAGKTVICADCSGAGAGETIYWCKGKEASFPFLPALVPSDNTVVGIVDLLHVKR